MILESYLRIIRILDYLIVKDNIVVDRVAKKIHTGLCKRYNILVKLNFISLFLQKKKKQKTRKQKRRVFGFRYKFPNSLEILPSIILSARAYFLRRTIKKFVTPLWLGPFNACQKWFKSDHGQKFVSDETRNGIFWDETRHDKPWREKSHIHIFLFSFFFSSFFFYFFAFSFFFLSVLSPSFQEILKSTWITPTADKSLCETLANWDQVFGVVMICRPKFQSTSTL